MAWRDFFYFSKADRRVLLLLVGLLSGIVLTTAFFLWVGGKDADTLELGGQHQEYADFLQQLQRVDTVKPMEEPYAQPQKHVPETFAFDPNTADSTTLLRLGLSAWQVRNIYKFRARGGRYHRPEDFSRLYGLTKGDYDRLFPYIRIADEFKLMADLPPVEETQDTVQPLRHERQEKFEEGVRVDLNTADTATLKKIPGIGSYYARQIANYRNRLGGYVSVAQLSEIDGLPEHIERWFTVEPSVSRYLYINQMSVDVLRRHPYLNFYQSRVIVEHRRKYGAIRTLQDLSLYEEFTPADMERLQPYVSFEE